MERGYFVENSKEIFCQLMYCSLLNVVRNEVEIWPCFVLFLVKCHTQNMNSGSVHLVHSLVEMVLLTWHKNIYTWACNDDLLSMLVLMYCWNLKASCPCLSWLNWGILYVILQVIEFVQFKDRLQHSSQYLVARVETPILQLKQNADNIEEEEVIHIFQL